MSNSPQYALTFDLNVLNHLGIGLYSNIPAVLSEMVANAWDAGATQVDIVLENDQIQISDNGRGMTISEINQRYLRIGYQKRRDELTIPVNGGNRHVMGRKGIGKLSAFSIANIVKLQTVKDGAKNGFIMSRAQIEDGINRGALQYSPQPLDVSQITIGQGTNITLTDITQPLAGLEEALRIDLARRFSVVGNDRQFDVFINGTAISLKDRDYYEKIQFIWYLGAESEAYVQRCDNKKEAVKLDDTISSAYKVSGWIATVAKPKDIDDQHHAISIFAHGKLIQEDILSDIQDARVYTQYVIGEIDADFMDADDEADIITSDRQRINQNDPRYIMLRDFVARQLRIIGNSWTGLRNKYKKKQGTSQPAPNAPEQPALFDPPLEPEGDALPPQTPITTPIGGVPGTDTPTPSEGAIDGGTVNSPQTAPGDRLRPPPPPAREAQTTFSSIRDAVDASSLEQAFKDIILYDLEQARLAYYNRGYKACVIMLGAVVEGLMLGTLQRPEVMDLMINDANPPGALNRMREMRNPIYSDRAVFRADLGERLGFDEYRQIIQHYVSQSQHLGISDVQRFRNAVHPWKCIQLPDVYGYYGAARALAHLASLEPLANFLLAWTL